MCGPCPLETQVWDTYLSKCVSCPDEAPVLSFVSENEAMVCVTCEAEYGPSWSFWHPKVNECVRACPDDTAPFWNPET